MAELDFFDDLISRLEEILASASQPTQKLIEPHIADIISLSRDRRSDLYMLGKHLCQIRMALADDSVELGDRFSKLLNYDKSMHTAMRIYQRFATYERYLPLIHVSVQRYFADHTYSPDALRDTIALAKDGCEVNMGLLREEVLPRYQALPSSALVTEPPPIEADEDEDDTDPWDMDDDEALAPQVSAPRTVAADSLKVERVDLDDMREKLIRNLTTELSGAFRSIDNFCETYKVRKGGWFLRFKNGGDTVLESLDEWKTDNKSLNRH